VLIASGIERVKVLPLSQRLGVTTGSFYWHFADREELLTELLDDWKATNSKGFLESVAASPDPHEQFDRLVDIWIHERGFSSAYDSAIRDWARVTPKVETVVRAVDEHRIEHLRCIFSAMGDPEPDDIVRARITYYHQIGYYALQIVLPLEQRELLKPVYTRLLKGAHHRHS
jgi:AcrR family transcriptional regulator